MTRKRFQGLRLELCRRIWVKEYGSAKGFLKGSKLRDAKPNFKIRPGSYKQIWDEDFKELRKLVNM